MFLSLTEKKSVKNDELKKVYKPIKDMVSKCERELAKKAKERVAKGFSGLIHPMFKMQRISSMPIKLKEQSTY